MFDIDAGSNSFTDTTPQLGIVYYYRIKAINSFGESSYSNEVSCDISGQLELTIVVNNPEDIVIDLSHQSDIAVAKGDVLSLGTVNEFDSYRWLLDGNDVGTTQVVDIDTGLLEPGVHHVTVVVTYDDSPYSKSMRFRVEN